MSGINGMNDFEKPEQDPLRPGRNHIRKLIGEAVSPLLDAVDIDNDELADRMFELAESGLLPNNYSAVCLEAGMRLKEKGEDDHE